MPLTPVEIRHIQLKRGLFGYRKSAVHRLMDDIADSFEAVWRERSQLVERVEGPRHRGDGARRLELEGLLRSTLVSAERASQDLKGSARREADVIVTEAHAEARKVLRDAISDKEQLMRDRAPRAGGAPDGTRDRRRDSGRGRGAQQQPTRRTLPPGRWSRAPPLHCRRLGKRKISGSSRVGRLSLGRCSLARLAFISASLPVPAVRPSSVVMGTPGNCGSRRSPSGAVPTRRSSSCSQPRCS